MNPERKKTHEDGFSKALDRKPNRAKKRIAVDNENIIFCTFQLFINEKVVKKEKIRNEWPSTSC